MSQDYSVLLLGSCQSRSLVHDRTESNYRKYSLQLAEHDEKIAKRFSLSLSLAIYLSLLSQIERCFICMENVCALSAISEQAKLEGEE